MNSLKIIKKAIILYTAVTVIEQLLKSNIKELNSIKLDSEITLPKKTNFHHQSFL